jgi:hypothetical protein
VIDFNDGPPDDGEGIYFVWDIYWDCNDEPWDGYFDHREKVMNWLDAYRIPHTSMVDPRSFWGEERVLVLRNEEDLRLYHAHWSSSPFYGVKGEEPGEFIVEDVYTWGTTGEDHITALEEWMQARGIQYRFNEIWGLPGEVLVVFQRADYEMVRDYVRDREEFKPMPRQTTEEAREAALNILQRIKARGDDVSEEPKVTAHDILERIKARKDKR